MGINTARLKILAFAISAMAGMAGGIFWYQGFLFRTNVQRGAISYIVRGALVPIPGWVRFAGTAIVSIIRTLNLNIVLLNRIIFGVMLVIVILFARWIDGLFAC